MHRKTFILGGLSASLSLSLARSQTGSEVDFPSFDELASGLRLTEDQVSDDLPDSVSQTMDIHKQLILKSATDPIDPNFPKLSKVDLGVEMVEVALKTDRYNGRSRANNGEKLITEMLSLAGNNPYKNTDGTYVPFCAAGLVHLACVAYSNLSKNNRLKDVVKPGATATERHVIFDKLLPTLREHYFFPSAGVRFIVAYARDKKKNWWTFEEIRGSKRKISKGWLAVFRWPRGFHIGIVTETTDSASKFIHTFDFNTANPDAPEGADERNGGWIGIRKRELTSAVVGFVSLN